jgi:hypothetical protein
MALTSNSPVQAQANTSAELMVLVVGDHFIATAAGAEVAKSTAVETAILTKHLAERKDLVVNGRPDGLPVDSASKRYTSLDSDGNDTTPLEAWLIAQPKGWWNRIPGNLGWVLRPAQPAASTLQEALARVAGVASTESRAKRGGKSRRRG